MLTPAKALSQVLSHCLVQPCERVALSDALGRVLARPIRAERDLPPADRSTMDGYAVRADDFRSVPRELRVIGEVAAGSRARLRVRPRTCARTFTGANLPPGADAVVTVEETSEVSSRVVCFRAPAKRGQNILRRGEIARKGQILLSKGIRLAPQQIAACAAVGADPVPVVVQPLVGVLCTGAELVEASADVSRHSQRDSNGPALQAALQATGLARFRSFGVAPDEVQTLRRKVRTALALCDVLLLVGGVSVGAYDLVPRALNDLGCRAVFHGVAMRPGKPTLFALGPDRQLVFGLPGNPLSALTTFWEFVAPALRKMEGMAEPLLTRMRVRLQSAVTSTLRDRTLFFPARLRFDPNEAAPIAIPIATRGSADVAAAGQCDGMIVVPRAKRYERGRLVEFHPWGLDS